MNPAWRRRLRGPTALVVALGLAPLLAPSSGPVSTAAVVTPPAQTPVTYAADVFATPSPVPAAPGLDTASPASASRKRNGEVHVVSAKGTRVWTASALADHGLPVAAKKAYRGAAALMARTDPSCELAWTLLAGIGRVESDHGRYAGSRLGADGLSRPRIIGVPLNGKGPVAAITDTDDGRLDGDRVWDRAVGPMQFIPSTWKIAARDGDEDGHRSPHDLDDAAAAAAVYLCSGSGSLQEPAAQAEAIYRYNQDDYYVALVQAFEVGYRTGVFSLPEPPPADEELAERRRKRLASRREALREERREARRERRERREQAEDADTPSVEPAPKPQGTPSGEPSPKPKPTPKPAPTPSEQPTDEPSPQAPTPVTVTGKLTECGAGLCLAGKPLDLGALSAAEETAPADYDGDGTKEPNAAELAGLLGTDVTMVLVKMDDGLFGILSINDLPVA